MLPQWPMRDQWPLSHRAPVCSDCTASVSERCDQETTRLWTQHHPHVYRCWGPLRIQNTANWLQTGAIVWHLLREPSHPLSFKTRGKLRGRERVQSSILLHWSLIIIITWLFFFLLLPSTLLSLRRSVAWIFLLLDRFNHLGCPQTCDSSLCSYHQ